MQFLNESSAAEDCRTGSRDNNNTETTTRSEYNESDLIGSSDERSNGDNSRLTQTDVLSVTDHQTSPAGDLTSARSATVLSRSEQLKAGSLSGKL